MSAEGWRRGEANGRGAEVVCGAADLGRAVETDRLGSVRGASGAGVTRYYPYGEEPVTTVQNRTKFATYYRDETTALDYADQRYYYRVIGRFLTADPYVAPGAVMNPTEWNRYAYVAGDPLNFWDRSGLCTAWAGTEVCFSGTAFGQPYGLAGIIRSAGGGGAADWGFVMEEEFGGYGDGAGGGVTGKLIRVVNPS